MPCCGPSWPTAPRPGAPRPWAAFQVLAGSPLVLERQALALALVGLAAGTALAGRWRPASELPWLAYPILGALALKLLAEDLPRGRPATMFLAFTLFGVGLPGVPRLLARNLS